MNELPVSEPQMFAMEHHGLDTASKVLFYENDYYPLSNFSAFSLFWEGYDFPTSEHAYQFSKFIRTAPEIAEKIRNSRSARAAFKLAEANIRSREPDWLNLRIPIMLRILYAKVEQHEYVKKKLLSTGHRELIENSWRDSFWGWGFNRQGKNMLGKLWMFIRDDIREERASDGEKDE